MSHQSSATIFVEKCCGHRPLIYKMLPNAELVVLQLSCDMPFAARRLNSDCVCDLLAEALQVGFSQLMQVVFLSATPDVTDICFGKIRFDRGPMLLYVKDLRPRLLDIGREIRREMHRSDNDSTGADASLVQWASLLHGEDRLSYEQLEHVSDYFKLTAVYFAAHRLDSRDLVRLIDDCLEYCDLLLELRASLCLQLANCHVPEALEVLLKACHTLPTQVAIHECCSGLVRALQSRHDFPQAIAKVSTMLMQLSDPAWRLMIEGVENAISAACYRVCDDQLGEFTTQQRIETLRVLVRLTGAECAPYVLALYRLFRNEVGQHLTKMLVDMSLRYIHDSKTDSDRFFREVTSFLEIDAPYRLPDFLRSVGTVDAKTQLENLTENDAFDLKFRILCIESLSPIGDAISIARLEGLRQSTPPNDFDDVLDDAIFSISLRLQTLGSSS